MKYQKTLEAYLQHITDEGYTKEGVARKKIILSNYLPYALILFYPDVLESLKRITHPTFCSHEQMDSHEKPENLKVVKQFLDTLKSEKSAVRYVNLNAYLQTRDENLNEDNEILIKFLKAQGSSLNLNSVTKQVFQQSMGYLKGLGKERIEGCSRQFFNYCFSQGWVHFNPAKNKRKVYIRVFEPDFLSIVQGKWRDCLEDYIAYMQVEKNLSDGGIDYQVRKLKIYTAWLCDNHIKYPNTDDLKQFLQFEREKGVKEITLSKYLYTIKYFFNFLIDTGKLKTNPAHELRIKNRLYAEGDVLTEQEVFTVIEHLDREIAQNKKGKSFAQRRSCFVSLRNLALFNVIISTGLRLSELSGIQLKDLDWNKKTVKVTVKGNKSVKQKIRNIHMNEYVWQLVQLYLNKLKLYRQEYLWISINGTPLTNSGINKIIKTVVRNAGIQKCISPHRLRATCASLYVKKGVDPFSLKTIMGHQSIATTMDQYTKLTEKDLREIWKKTNPLAGIDDE